MTTPSADDQVREWITREARESADDQHLRSCGGLTIEHPAAADGSYGCPTGCEYLRLRADLHCPHGHRETFVYGEFGELSFIIEEISKSSLVVDYIYDDGEVG